MGYKQPVHGELRLDDTVNQPVRRTMAPVGGPTVQECARQNGRPAGLLPREDDFEVALAEFLDCTSQRQQTSFLMQNEYPLVTFYKLLYIGKINNLKFKIT